ncbi:MAG: 50S ribosomal protein L9 [Clostridia bacterium]|nr:50S ribosomal protein L9 [Clostridia bacterium]
MKVILLKDVKDLGKKDQIVEVSDGYGKNFLVPRGIAKIATAGSINEALDKQKAQEAKKARELAQAKELANEISSKRVILKAKLGENGKLFGAVSAKDIADAMKAQFKIDLDKKKIELGDPIKSQGVFDVTAKVYAGVVAKFQVEVQAQ